MKVKCPRCKQETEYVKENPFRPFCSERCKLIDLGQWADGKYAVPVTDPNELDDEHLDTLAQALPPTDPDDQLN
ncbi:MAG: DNA gyrase inhibitor YacG [Bdellovibrionaceae bacterium]|nr:DNA gyrase inhibitor YacG [Pseudobdellovibrionaceae bacterium]